MERRRRGMMMMMRRRRRRRRMTTTTIAVVVMMMMMMMTMMMMILQPLQGPGVGAAGRHADRQPPAPFLGLPDPRFRGAPKSCQSGATESGSMWEEGQAG
jgi:hypothetical protein